MSSLAQFLSGVRREQTAWEAGAGDMGRRPGGEEDTHRGEKMQALIHHVMTSHRMDSQWKSLLVDDLELCCLYTSFLLKSAAKRLQVCDFDNWLETGLEEIGRKCKQDINPKKPLDLTTIQEMISRVRFPGEDKVGQLGKLLLMRSKMLLKRSLGDPLLNFEATLRDLRLAREGGGLAEEELSDLCYLVGVCQSKLRLFDDAAASMEESKNFMDASQCNEMKRDARKKKIAVAQKSIQLGKNTVLGGTGGSQRPIPKLMSTNEAFPSISGSVKVTMDQEKGRKIVSEKEIQPGEILIIEKSIFQQPYSLDRSVALSHCHHCMVFSYNLLPCPNCSDVLFCSDACRVKACSSYHKFECELGLGKIQTLFKSQDAFNEPVAGKVLFPLRILFSHPLDYYAALGKSLPLLEPVNYNVKNSAQDPYLSDDEKNFWNLETKFENLQQKKEVASAFLIFVSICYELVKVSGYLSAPEDSEAETLVIRLLIHASRVIQLNLFTGNEPIEEHLYSSKSLLTAVQKKRIFHGVFNTISLVNHSCVFNTGYITVDNKLVLIAARPIKRGEEITISYSPDIDDEELWQRRIHLQLGYGFTCACIGCRNGWGPCTEYLEDVRRIVYFGPEATTVLQEKLLTEKDLSKLVESCYREQYKMLKGLKATMKGGMDQVVAVSFWNKYFPMISMLYSTFIRLK